MYIFVFVNSVIESDGFEGRQGIVCGLPSVLTHLRLSGQMGLVI